MFCLEFETHCGAHGPKFFDKTEKKMLKRSKQANKQKDGRIRNKGKIVSAGY
jgi:hypothetical protein